MVQSYSKNDSITEVLKKSKGNGDFEKATEYQYEDFDKIMNELSSLQSEKEKLNELMLDHIGLFDLVVTAKKLDPDKKFMQFCEKLDVK